MKYLERDAIGNAAEIGHHLGEHNGHSHMALIDCVIGAAVKLARIEYAHKPVWENNDWSSVCARIAESICSKCEVPSENEMIEMIGGV